MKAIKTGGALLISMAFLAGAAHASDASYGLPAKADARKAAGQANGNVVLHNYTYGSYTVYATFQSSGKSLPPMGLGPRYSGTDTITYRLQDADYQVCLNIQPNIFNGCVGVGNDVNVGNPNAPKNQVSGQKDQPVKVTITKR